MSYFKTTLALFVLFIVCSVVAASDITEACDYRQCLAVVDAGSTASRLFIYAYDLDEQKAPIHLEKLYSKKVTPGFAKVDSNEKAVSDYLDQLLSGTFSRTLPLLFYSTAGMRLLSEEEQAKRYESLTHWFAKNGHWRLLEARTITGKEEGIFGWLALNYAKGRLYSSDKPLLGSVEVGGASSQIVFPLNGNENVQHPDIVMLHNSHRHTAVFSHSFLGLGINEIVRQFANTPTCFPDNMILPNSSKGRGRAPVCAHIISAYLNRTHRIKKITSSSLAQRATDTWYVIGGINALVSHQPFEYEDYQFQAENLLKQGQKALCQVNHQTLLESYPDNPYILNGCIATSYYYALLINSYQLSPTMFFNYPADEDNVSWTRGVVLNQSSQVTLSQNAEISKPSRALRQSLSQA